MRDLKLAFRTLSHRPVFFAAATLTLGLGLGAAVATFAIVDRLLLRPLDYPRADRLVFVTGFLPGEAGPGSSLSIMEIADIRARARTLSSLAAYADSRPLDVAADSGPQSARVNFVNTNWFELLGAHSAIGRLLNASDEQTVGAHPVAVVSDAFWRTHLGARQNVIGSTLRIADVPYTVVGVMSPAFRDMSYEYGGDVTDIWLSMSMSAPAYGPTFLTTRSSRVVWGIGRLADGVTIDQARSELNGIARDLEREFPDSNRRMGLHAERLDLWIFRDARMPFFVVLIGALALLAVGALNVTGLLVVRMAERSRDLIVRRALGASTGQLARPAVAESLAIAMSAAVAGAGVGAVLLSLVRTSAPYVFPRLQVVQLDGRSVVVLGVLASLAVAVTAIATLAMVRWRGQLAAGAARAVTADRLTVRLQRALVVGEVALAVILLAGSTLVVKSLRVFERTPLGFDSAGLVNTRMELRGTRYVENPAVVAFGQSLLEQARAVPGVDDAFLWGPGRPGYVTWISFVLPERVVNVPDPERVMVTRHNVSAGALASAGIPILRGREFRASDRTAEPFVAVVSQSMAEKFWPGQDPIGQRFSFITPLTPRPWFQVIGVAADAAHRRRTYSLRLPAYDYYQFFDQRPERSVTLVTRSSADPAAAMPGIRAAVQGADPALPVRDMRTMADLLGEEETTFRFASGLLSGFAALTFLFAAAGLYAMVSYVMTLRGRELALRSALGASRGRLFRSLVLNGVRLGVVGIGLGLIAARFSATFLDALLYGVDPHGVETYALTAIAMLIIVVAATAVPALRVRRIEASRALRAE